MPLRLPAQYKSYDAADRLRDPLKRDGQPAEDNLVLMEAVLEVRYALDELLVAYGVLPPEVPRTQGPHRTFLEGTKGTSEVSVLDGNREPFQMAQTPPALRLDILLQKMTSPFTREA